MLKAGFYVIIDSVAGGTKFFNKDKNQLKFFLFTLSGARKE